MNQKTPFIGRTKELNRLRYTRENQIADLVVIRGRRRIGKTRLAEEFGKSFKKVLLFTGLPPIKGITAQKQRNHFSVQFSKQTGLPLPSIKDWSYLFWHLANYCRDGDILLIIDEISWLGIKDPTFLGKFKTIWDESFKKNPNLVIILMGSVSSWIEKNILTSTGFVGRISMEMTLKELPLHHSNAFFRNYQLSSYEKFKILSVTGGVPRYLEEIIPSCSSNKNIERLCFKEGGFLVKEFKHIFSDLFHTRSPIYEKIVKHLVNKDSSRQQLSEETNISNSGHLTEYLHDLEIAGFISKISSWSIKNRAELKMPIYRLSDNYLRFYLKYIEPNLYRIKNDFYEVNPHRWTTIMGLQFENLVLNNQNNLFNLLNIDPHQIEWVSPYFQRRTSRNKECQIDLLIQTCDQCLYICEIKFSMHPIPVSVVEEVKQKIAKMTLPRGFSIRPVLIHVNGVSPALLAEEYFSSVIDFGQLLELKPLDTKKEQDMLIEASNNPTAFNYSTFPCLIILCKSFLLL